MSGEELSNLKSKCWTQGEQKSTSNLSAIQIMNLSSTWDNNRCTSGIKSATASFEQGKVIAIIGAVGCGKVKV